MEVVHGFYVFFFRRGLVGGGGFQQLALLDRSTTKFPGEWASKTLPLRCDELCARSPRNPNCAEHQNPKLATSPVAG